MKPFIFLAIIALLLVSLYCVARSKKNSQNSLTMERLCQDQTDGKRIIRAIQMTKSEVENAINDFIKLNEENGSEVDRPQVVQQENAFMLYLPDSTTYDQFCYWVNYMVYSNKDKKYNNNITGWYEVPANAKGVWQQFANQRLMFFIPETDTEYDNVYVMTKDNICYKQEFAFRASFILQSKVYREYNDIP